MPIITLNQATLTQLKCDPEKSHIEYCSDEIPGLMLDVYPTGKATWKLRYKVENTTKYFSFGPLSEVTLAQARRMALEMKAQIRAQGRDPRAEIKAKKEMLTFDEFYEQHLKPYCQPRKRSWARDEQLYRIRIKDKFGNKRLNQITRHQIQTFHTELLAEGLSHASCDLHLRFIKHAFYLAIDWELMPGVNQAARIPMYAIENYVNNIPNDAEFSRLIHVLQTDPNRNICQLAIFLMATSMRLGEALTCQWNDLDLQNNVLLVKAIHSKNGRQRYVSLSTSALAVIDKLDTKGKYDYLFINKKTGKPYTTITKVWDRLRNKAGLPKLRCHDLRHIGATLMINAGVGLHLVSKALGHSNTTITEKRYAHISSKTMKHAVDCASNVIEQAMRVKPLTIESTTVEVLPLLPDASQPSPAPSQSVEDVAVIEVVPEDRLAA